MPHLKALLAGKALQRPVFGYRTTYIGFEVVKVSLELFAVAARSKA
jgi:hypothetical protein